MDERILCAAIWYKDFGRPVHTVKNCRVGVVLCGHRHPQIIHQHVVLMGKKQHEMGEYEQGFLTNTNRFVSRAEAYQIAGLANQLISGNGIELYSEDLY